MMIEALERKHKALHCHYRNHQNHHKKNTRTIHTERISALEHTISTFNRVKSKRRTLVLHDKIQVAGFKYAQRLVAKVLCAKKKKHNKNQKKRRKKLKKISHRVSHFNLIMMIFQWHSADFSITFVSFATVQQYVSIVLVLLNVFNRARTKSIALHFLLSYSVHCTHTCIISHFWHICL